MTKLTKTITVKRLGPTDHHGSRLRAFDAAGNVKYTAYPGHMTAGTEELYKVGAQALCDKLGWTGELIGGILNNDSWVFLFKPEDVIDRCGPAYEGFTNQETFILSQAINNNGTATQAKFENIAMQVLATSKSDNKANRLGEHLLAYFGEHIHDFVQVDPMFDDLLSTALNRVNFTELAADLIAKVREDAKAVAK